MNLDTNLFAPLSRQERLEEHAERLTKQTIDNLWYELTDELEVEKFIQNYVADPHKMLRDIIQYVAIAREKQIKCTIAETSAREDEKQSIRLNAYWKINSDVQDYIERAADHIVEERMYA